MAKDKTRNNGDGDNGDVLSDDEVVILEANGITVDRERQDCFDSEGNMLPPAVDSAVIRMSENPPAQSEWGTKGFDAMGLGPGLGRQATPNSYNQPSLSYPTVGTPPADFVQPGTALDSDGLMGPPGEVVAAVEGYASQVDTGGSALSASGPAMAQDLAAARSRGNTLWSSIQPKGGEQVTPQSLIDKGHRHSTTGRYVEGAQVPGMPPSHDVMRHDLSDTAQVEALRGGAPASNPNGPPPSADEHSVVIAPTVTILDQSKIKGASL